MKKLTVILFENNLESKECYNIVCEKFANLPAEKEFCGIWGEILFNRKEVLKTISATVNNFINNVDKTEVYFGCSEKDYKDIISFMDTDNCKINILSSADF